jgi:hypothetical protein
MDAKKVKRIAESEVGKHVKKMHKHKKGGVTSGSMKQMGRNMARAMNQRGK